MSWFVIIFFLSLAFNSLSEAGHEKNLPSAIVVGSVYCDTCFQEDFSKSSHFISGASVAVECKYGTSKPSFHKEVKTDQHGEFKVHLPFSVSKHVKKIEGCSVKLISSSEPYCAVASTATSSSLRLKSRKQGTHIFSAGFFTFKPLKQPNLCNQKPSIQNSKELGSNKLSPTDGLDFPPPIQDPTSPYLPPLPKLPELPPLPLVPPLSNLPPLPLVPLVPPLPNLPLPPLLPPLPNLPLPPLPLVPPLPNLPPLPLVPPLPNLPGLPFPPPILGKTTNSKPTTTESLKKTQLQDEKEAHPDDLLPPLLPPLFPPLLPPILPPNPFQPSPLIPNPFQPPPLIPNPFQPPPAPLLPSPPAGPAPFFPFPPIPGFTPSPPPPALPFPLPPIVPLPPIPRIPGIPPAPSSKQISSP